MSTEKDGALRGAAKAVVADSSRPPPAGKVLPFRRPQPRCCGDCGAPLSAAPAWHTRCRACYRLAILASALRRWGAS